jgi:hypothetical protein
MKINMKPINKTFKKSEITDLVGKKNMNLPIGQMYSMGKKNTSESESISKKEMMEKWSKKYKDSINCENPKGFSQKAHCQGKKKKTETKEATGASSAGAFVAPVAFKDSKFVRNSFKETPKKTETKEATGASSAGSYVTPAAWAKSMSKKDWRGKSKTQIPGGQFVQVKDKCKKFPYCNQGDIKALKLTNEEKLNETIKKISQKYNVSENYIFNLLKKQSTYKK